MDNSLHPKNASCGCSRCGARGIATVNSEAVVPHSTSKKAVGPVVLPLRPKPLVLRPPGVASGSFRGTATPDIASLGANEFFSVANVTQVEQGRIRRPECATAVAGRRPAVVGTTVNSNSPDVVSVALEGVTTLLMDGQPSPVRCRAALSLRRNRADTRYSLRTLSVDFFWNTTDSRAMPGRGWLSAVCSSSRSDEKSINVQWDASNGRAVVRALCSVSSLDDIDPVSDAGRRRSVALVEWTIALGHATAGRTESECGGTIRESSVPMALSIRGFLETHFFEGGMGRPGATDAVRLVDQSIGKLRSGYGVDPAQIFRVQPVFLRTDAQDRNPSGRYWPRARQAMESVWRRVGVAFSYAEPISLNAPLHKELVAEYTVNGRAPVRNENGRDVGDGRVEDGAYDLRNLADYRGAIGVFFAARFRPVTRRDELVLPWGGGRTFLGGLPQAFIIVTDQNDTETDALCLAHEMGHAIGFNHPGDPAEVNQVPGSPGSIMCPSGYGQANPTLNTRYHFENLAGFGFPSFGRRHAFDCNGEPAANDCGPCAPVESRQLSPADRQNPADFSE